VKPVCFKSPPLWGVALISLCLWQAVTASLLPPLVKTIPLTGVEGRIDHLALDVSGRRLFVAAIGNNSVEVIDLEKGERIHSITGLDEPQGVLYNPDTKEIVVSSGGDGTCKFYSAQTYELLRTATVSADADNLRLDTEGNRIYVGCGDGMISALNAGNGTRMVGSDVKLPEHPESFQVEQFGSRIFANLPEQGKIAVLDRGEQRLKEMWALDSVKSNFPMALDEPDHRLFIGCRHPSRLVVLGTDQGEFIASLECVGDADDVFYDDKRNRIYVTGGEGFMDVFRIHDPNHYFLEGKIPTARGARTCLLSAELNALYLAVPHHGPQPAEIRVYDLLAK